MKEYNLDNERQYKIDFLKVNGTLECRYDTEGKGFLVSTNQEDINEKLGCINEVLKWIHDPHKEFILTIKDKTYDFDIKHTELPKSKVYDNKDFELFAYLNNIQAGMNNDMNIVLNFKGDNVEINLEPNAYYLKFFDVKDLASGFINDPVVPKKEFIIDENKVPDNMIDIESKEKKNIKEYFKKYPGKVTTFISKYKGPIITAGAVAALLIGMKGNGSSTKENKDNSSLMDSSSISSSSVESIDSKNDESSIDENISSYTLSSLYIYSDDYKNSVYNDVENKYGNLLNKLGKTYGIDEKLLAALITQESNGVSSKEFNEGGAIGLCQIQNSNLGAELNIHNYETDTDETITYDMETLTNDEGNIKCCIAYLQTLLKQYNGNLIMALQAYNYGATKVNNIVEEYANESLYASEDQVTFKSFNDVVNDYNDLGWINYCDPNYGDYLYIEHVLSSLNGENKLNFKIGEKDLEYKITINEKSLSKY